MTIEGDYADDITLTTRPSEEESHDNRKMVTKMVTIKGIRS